MVDFQETAVTPQNMVVAGVEGRVAMVAGEETLVSRHCLAGVEVEVAPFLMARTAKTRPAETADISVAGEERMLGQTPKARSARVAAVVAAAVKRSAIYFQPALETEARVTSSVVAVVARVTVGAGASVAEAEPVTVHSLLCLAGMGVSVVAAALPLPSVVAQA